MVADDAMKNDVSAESPTSVLEEEVVCPYLCLMAFLSITSSCIVWL